MTDFFVNNHVQSTINKVVTRLELKSGSSPFEKSLYKYTKIMLKDFIKNAKSWDKYCNINIGISGDTLMDSIDEVLASGTKEKETAPSYHLVFALSMRFYCEMDITMNETSDRNYSDIRRWTDDNIGKFDELSRAHLDFAFRDLPAAIVKDIIHSNDFDTIRRFSSQIETIEQKISTWDDDLSSKVSTVEALESQLRDHETAFNFVGLYDGFNDLSKSKVKEKLVLKCLLFLMGLLTTLPIFYQLSKLNSGLDNIEGSRELIALTLVPTISLVAIFIYFFRVVLSNYTSVKSQIVQVELRKTLCQFIQAYSNYSKELKAANSEALIKFESLIFSDITTSVDPKHSPYEMIESLGKLLKK